MAWKFDRTMTVGDVLQIVILLAAIAAAYVKLDMRLTVVETRLEPLYLQYVGARK